MSPISDRATGTAILGMIVIACISGSVACRRPSPAGQEQPAPTPAPASPQPATLPSGSEAGTLWVDPVAGMRFRFIPSGEFTMGSPPSVIGRHENEMQRQVTVRRGFWLGETEVTQGQWQTVMGTNPSLHSECGEDCPAESVSWFDAIRFANRLSRTSGLPECYQVEGRRVYFSGISCQGYRLPTEAEWEFAARAGGSHIYSGSKDIDEVGWYRENSGGGANPVGRKRANAWELYDMTGNVWEWVWDWYGTYQIEDVTDPMGPSAGSRRVFRGCGWNTYALHCRTSFRHSFLPESRDPTIGVRLARSQ